MIGIADDFATKQDQSQGILLRRPHLCHEQEPFSKGNQGTHAPIKKKKKKNQFFTNSLKCVLSFSGGTPSEVIRCTFLGFDQVAQTELG